MSTIENQKASAEAQREAVLCCNGALGQFCDNEDLLVKAGRYLHERTQ